MRSELQLDINQLIETFNQAVLDYDRVAVLPKEIAERMLERFDLIQIKPQVILDIGCGTGFCTQLLSKRFPHAEIIALDIASGMLRFAKGHDYQAKKPLFINAEMGQLPLADDSVDLIISNLALPWALNLEFTFHEWRRVLRPNGLLMFSTFGPDTLKELRASWRQVDDHIHVHEFIDMHDVGDQLLHARFADPVMDIDHFTLAYSNVQTLMQELKSMGAHNLAIQRTQGMMSPERLKKMCDAYEFYRNEEGYLPVTCEIIYGHAWRPEIEKNAENHAAGEVHIPLANILGLKNR